jgi:hypothetical protein
MKRPWVFDIDGVLADFEGWLVDRLYEEFGDAALVHRNKYDFSERFRDAPEILEQANRLTRRPSSYMGIPPILEGVAFAQEILESGSQIFFVSARPDTVEVTTRHWLENNLDFSKSLGVYVGVNDKAKFFTEVFPELDIVAFVDDGMHQVNNLIMSGKKAFCWAQPWNEGCFPRLEVDREGDLWLWEAEHEEAIRFNKEKI